MTGCHTDDDASRFHHTKKLQKTVNRVHDDRAFRPAISSLKSMPASKREAVLKIWSRPLDRTWAQLGHIGPEGTTEAGQEIESEICTSLLTMIRQKVRAK